MEEGTRPEELTPEELAKVPELLARVGRHIDFASDALTDEEATLLARVVLNMGSAQATEMVLIARGKSNGCIPDPHKEG